MDFITYTKRIYEQRLSVFENTDFSSLEINALRALTHEASAMRKFLFDNRDDGYVFTFEFFKRELDAIARLDLIIKKGTGLLGLPDESSFHLCADRRSDVPPKTGKTRLFELSEYLHHLETLRSSDVDLKLLEPFAEWKHRTSLMLGELRRYRLWLETRNSSRQIFLLRDTLLLYLAARAAGNKEAVPLMIGRKYLERIDPSFYDSSVMDVLYDVISIPGLDGADVCEKYGRIFRARVDCGTHNVTKQIRTYLDSQLRDEEYSVVESGFQGTIPLLLHAADPRITGFSMYATLPWLNALYRDIVFQPNYHFLREMETLVSHDSLFEFDSVRGGRIFIREYQDETILAMGYYEIVTFRSLCAQILNTDVV
jgi:hypothetical protein